MVLYIILCLTLVVLRMLDDALSDYAFLFLFSTDSLMRYQVALLPWAIWFAVASWSLRAKIMWIDLELRSSSHFASCRHKLSIAASILGICNMMASARVFGWGGDPLRTLDFRTFVTLSTVLPSAFFQPWTMTGTEIAVSSPVALIHPL
jgi:hypothetical protein